MYKESKAESIILIVFLVIIVTMVILAMTGVIKGTKYLDKNQESISQTVGQGLGKFAGEVKKGFESVK